MSPLQSEASVPNCRSTRRRVQDFDWRLGLSETAMPSNSRNGGQAIPIVVEDDDDDVQVSSPRSFAQARSSACSRPHRPMHIPVLDDADLELRLGPAGLGPAAARLEPSVVRLEPSIYLSYPDHSLNAAIDLTSSKNIHGVKHGIDVKRKYGEPISEPSKEIKLTCAICMDTMKDETSTVCGHLFCKKCITTAIQAQKKCPTCRKKLASNQIHRIYLSGSTS